MGVCGQNNDNKKIKRKKIIVESENASNLPAPIRVELPKPIMNSQWINNDFIIETKKNDDIESKKNDKIEPKNYDKIESKINDNIESKKNDKIEFKNNDINLKFEHSYPDLEEIEQKKNYIIKTNTDIEIFNLTDAENFVYESKIQDIFFEKEGSDDLYNILNDYEKKILTEFFLEKISYFFNDILKVEPINLKLDKNLVSNIIKNENSDIIYKNIIMEEINNIKNDPEKCKIQYLTVLLAGRHKIGKKSVIKYMLKDDKDLQIEKDNKDTNFTIYKSDKKPNFQYIKYKGIGYDNHNKTEEITKNTVNFISSRVESGNHNNFVHCIWYCITGNGIEDIEIRYLKEIMKAYPNSNIPIIIVYLNRKTPEKIKKIIKDELKDVEFAEVTPKDIRRPNNKIKKAEGDDNLENLTIKKINEALNSNMQKIMIEIIKKEVNDSIKNKNKTIKKQINDMNINNFITGYKKVMNDYDFINYLIDITGRNLYGFFRYPNNEKRISNKSLNLIINSSIIKNTKKMMNLYKSKINELIENIVNEMSEEFLDKQANIENFKKGIWNVNIKEV